MGSASSVRGSIGLRFDTADEARDYALEWSKRWIASQATRPETERAVQRVAMSMARASNDENADDIAPVRVAADVRG
ncbi:hypothetical protein [Candidatus Burkholderia verschuerenii]|uniref:hypothetical protein n=1 Tax=Candidatus Burkholderia verschuerenii TaxID=242163 RepID=UPI000A82BDDF|nr:hypothetical protein [Candidatus Burkholderia verschuerenii]